MATEINTKLDNPVVAILKKDLKAGDKVQAMVKAGVPRSQVSLYMYRLEHVADPSLKLGKSPKQVKSARDSGIRWERIAYRAGLVDSEGSLGAAVAKVKELYKQGGGDPDAYVGRGRRFDGSTASAKSTGTSGRRGAKAAQPTGTSGRRGAANAKAEPAKSGRRGGKAAPAGRRGTRAAAGSSPK